MNADRPDPQANGARTVGSDGHPDPSRGDHSPALSGPVSTLDRVTLRLGVAVAVLIALCSYAVSATSLYALGVQAGYSRWQATAVPVVADGPAIYGMFRIVSRSRRNAKGAGYGWLLVIAGTAASIGGNVAHAQPDLVAQGIAAAIPLAVLAMLEGLKGDAGEVTRLTTQTVIGAAGTGDQASVGVSGQPTIDRVSVHRTHTPPAAHEPSLVDRPRPRQLPARAPRPDGAAGVRQRLAAAYSQGRPDRQPWTARTLAEAAGCGRSSAASFLQTQRQPATGEVNRS